MSRLEFRRGHGSRLSGPRRGALFGIVAVWLAGLAWLLGGPGLPVSTGEVVVTHWANGHMMNNALLPLFAEQFNRAGHITPTGKRIVVRPVLVNSGVMTDELIARSTRGAALDPKLPDPALVTPAAEHWLGQVNYAAGRAVVDLATSQPLARTWIGIVTYREMAECLGWPNKEIGFADIVALRTNPRGWLTCPTAKSEWGQQPLMPFTDPSSSSTARSMLYALYSIAAGKQPSQLTPADVANPAVVDYVKAFQRSVDHYVFDTLILNSKIYLGPRYGHFFFVSEDNLVQLYQGKLAVTAGTETKPQPLSRSMVMIYPKEGSIAHNHSATPVVANWVTPDQAEAAQQWVAFLRADAAQRAFMEEGFRPGTNIPYADTISSRYGLDPSKPTKTLNSDRVEPAAADAIVDGWGEVKKPGVVTFVVDVSGSMQGAKLEQAKQGVIRALDGMNNRNRVGLLTFGSGIQTRIPVDPIVENRFEVAKAVQAMQVRGGTALYDAIREGIRMTDEAPGDEDAIRGLVVLTDGRANEGRTRLDDLVKMISRGEKPIRRFGGFEDDMSALQEDMDRVPKRDVIGTQLAVPTKHQIHLFFVGIGTDADFDVGRILAEATGSAFQAATEKDLASVLEKFGKYF